MPPSDSFEGHPNVRTYERHRPYQQFANTVHAPLRGTHVNCGQPSSTSHNRPLCCRTRNLGDLPNSCTGIQRFLQTLEHCTCYVVCRVALTLVLITTPWHLGPVSGLVLARIVRMHRMSHVRRDQQMPESRFRGASTLFPVSAIVMRRIASAVMVPIAPDYGSLLLRGHTHIP